MFKKIAFGVVVAAIGAGLVYGAVNRTELRSTAEVGENRSESGQNGSNRNSENTIDGNRQENKNQNNDLSGSGNGSGKGNGGNGAGGNGGNSSRGSQAFGTSGGSGTGQANADDVYQVEGSAAEVSSDYLLLEALDGSQLVIENRAWWYAEEAGFSASVGDDILVTGFYDTDGTFEAMSIENKTQGCSAVIREDSGRPLWAGGNGGGVDK